MFSSKSASKSFFPGYPFLDKKGTSCSFTDNDIEQDPKNNWRAATASQ